MRRAREPDEQRERQRGSDGHATAPAALEVDARRPSCRRQRRRRDPAAAEAALAVVQHAGLPRGDGPHRRVGLDDPPAAASRLVRRRGPDRRPDERRAVADPDLRAERRQAPSRRGPRAGRRRRTCRRRAGSRASRGPARRPSTMALVAGSIARDVARLAERDVEALALADREPGRAVVLPHPAAVGVEDRPALRDPAAARPQLVAVVAARDEADLLALGLVGRHEAEAAGDVADLRLASGRPAGTGCATAGPGAGRTGSRSGPSRSSSARASVARGPSAVSTTTRRA